MSSAHRLNPLLTRDRQFIDRIDRFLKFYPQYTTSFVREASLGNVFDDWFEWYVSVTSTVRGAGDPAGYFAAADQVHESRRDQ